MLVTGEWIDFFGCLCTKSPSRIRFFLNFLMVANHSCLLHSRPASVAPWLAHLAIVSGIAGSIVTQISGFFRVWEENLKGAFQRMGSKASVSCRVVYTVKNMRGAAKLPAADKQTLNNPNNQPVSVKGQNVFII